MKPSLRSWLAPSALLALVVSGFAIAGAVVAKPGVSAAPSVHPTSLAPMRGFLDAAEYYQQALTGQRGYSRLPTEAELVRLQSEIDLLEQRWHELTVALHDRMAVVTLEAIQRGELAPADGRQPIHEADTIGTRFTVHAGIPYRKAFRTGDDAWVDALQHDIDELMTDGERLVEAAFE